MDTLRKITVEIPADLLESAQKTTREGVTQTVRAGLRLLAASATYSKLRQLQGTVRFACTAEQLRADR